MGDLIEALISFVVELWKGDAAASDSVFGESEQEGRRRKLVLAGCATIAVAAFIALYLWFSR